MNILFLFFLLFAADLAYAAQPVILVSSSTGGTTQNKDNERDIMYLVTQGDALMFSATVDQPVSYEWAVNKSTDAGRVTSVNTTDPQNDAINVPVDKSIAVSFNKNIQEGTGFGEISLMGPDNTAVAFTKSMVSNALKLDPVNELEYGKRYTVIVPKESVKDFSDRTLGSAYSFSFTTVKTSLERGAYVYPVPFKAGSDSALTFTNLVQPSKLEIYTLDGTLVYEKEINEYTHRFIPEGFSSGAYTYLIKNSKGTSSGKIVIIK